MKKIFYFLCPLLCLMTSVFSQTDPYPYRGLYVDKFVRYNTYASNIDEAKTLLGRGIEEDSLLNFARDHDFKYLILYDLNRIFNKPDSILPGSGGRTYKQALCDFIVKAKTHFCIQLIGAPISSTSFLNSITDFNSLIVSPPYIFNSSASSFLPSSPNPLSFVQNTYTASDGEIALRAEMVKTVLRLNDFNSSCSAKINVVTTEYEFWQQ